MTDWDQGCIGGCEGSVACVEVGAVEACIEHNIPMESPILEWMIPHSADAVNRLSVGKDGRTLHYPLYTRPFK